MELSIIILNYKMKGLVKNCLQAIFESELNAEYEVIVVDNDSNDGVGEMLAESFPNVKFIQSVKNLGMGGGNNLGIKAAKGEYVLILNPDIHVFKDSIAKLLAFAKGEQIVGVVAPRLLNPDRTLQHTCYRWHSALTPLYRRTFLGNLNVGKKDLHRFLMLDWDHNETREVDWLQGSCFMVAKKVLDEVGLFDESFFMYFEDTDLCRRIKSAGYKNIYFPGAEVIHFHRRQSADGGLINVLFNKMTRVHVVSWMRYLYKWRKT